MSLSRSQRRQTTIDVFPELRVGCLELPADWLEVRCEGVGLVDRIFVEDAHLVAQNAHRARRRVFCRWATVSERPARGSARKTAERTKAGIASKLAVFLGHPSRPPETLRYHELEGFLFAVGSAPELVRPSEWLPEVFGGQEAGFETLEEARAILRELMSLYNVVNASAASERATLPSDCRFRRKVLANLDEGAPMSLWSRGFLRGHQWLEEAWEHAVPDPLDQEFAMWLMTLSFFASRRLAESYVKELGRSDLEEAATLFRRAFPDALAEYARLGRTIHKVVMDDAAKAERRTGTKVGRNDPCPCGSGRKYKKCCGAGPAP